MNNVYITKANASKIIRKINLENVPSDGLLYRDIVKEYFGDQIVFSDEALLERENVLNKLFNIKERKFLFSYRLFMDNPQFFMDEIYENYPIKEDTYTWIYEDDKSPAFHIDPSCPLLNSDFKNFLIPASIRYKGISEKKKYAELTEKEKAIMRNNVSKYREWWNKYEDENGEKGGKYYWSKGKDLFLVHVNNIFQPEPRIRKIDEFEAKNTGWIETNNESIESIISIIDKLMTKYIKYSEKDNKHKIILKRYQSWFSNSIKFTNNNTGYTDVEIREILTECETYFKRPLKFYLKELYRRINNPNIELQENLLVQLGFRPCGYCGYVNLKRNHQQEDLSFPPTYTDKQEVNLDKNKLFYNDLDIDREEELIRAMIALEADEKNAQMEDYFFMIEEEYKKERLKKDKYKTF